MVYRFIIFFIELLSINVIVRGYISKAACFRELYTGIDSLKFSNISLDTLDQEISKLDQHLAENKKSVGEGHSGQSVATMERKYYAWLAKHSCVKSICEIGFNAGHSALGWLVHNHNATVLMFDLWNHDYSQTGEDYIRTLTHLNPSRMTVVKGNSLDTVPKFHTENPTYRCDLISVDGGHMFDVAVQDMDNMFYYAKPGFNLLLVDDTNCKAGYCVDKAVQEEMKKGVIKLIDGYSLDNRNRGISLLTYIKL